MYSQPAKQDDLKIGLVLSGGGAKGFAHIGALKVIDSLGIYKNLSFPPNYVLLRDSQRINLNRLIDSLAPIKIIADASNYKSYVQRWKATCTERKIPFHYTNEKGAYIFK